MSYYFVCDGGGSKTESLLFDESGRILARANGAGANALFLPREEAISTVLTQWNTVLREVGIQPEQVAAIRLFIPGFRCCEDAVRIQIHKQIDLEVMGDEINAFYGALGRPEGIAVLSGTGSFAVGKNREGKFACTGGWGPLMGDQGSGYYIGVCCLQELARLADSEIYGTVLEKKVLEKLNQPTILSLRERTSQPDFDRAMIAALCPVVAEAAKEKDPTAQKILYDAAAELADLAYKTAFKLQDDTLPVALIGGVSKMGSIFMDLFRENIRKRLPNAVCGGPAFSPVQGAVLYVLDQIAGVDISRSEILENIKII